MVDVMADFVFPITPSNVESGVASLISLLTVSDLLVNVIAVFDGGRRSQYVYVEDTLRKHTKSWSVLHNIVPEGYNKCFVDGVSRTLSDRILTMSPGVLIRDQSWFVKMSAPFSRDRQAAMTICGHPNCESKTIPPIRVNKSFLISHRLAMLKKWLKEDFRIPLPVKGVDIIHLTAESLVATGFSVWLSGGVRYELSEAKVHTV